MIKNCLCAGIVLLAVCGCSKAYLPENDAGNNRKELAVGVSLSGASKTALLSSVAGVYPAVWSEGDCISIAGNCSKPLTAAEAGKDRAVFKFDSDISLPFNIIYPASGKADVVHFESHQMFREGSFDRGVAPMYGTSREFGDISLHHLSSVLRFLMKAQTGHEEKITRVVVSSLGAEPLSGDFSIAVSQDGLLTGEITGQPGCASSVVLDCGEGVGLSSARESAFYLCVPYGTYSKGFKAEFVDEASESMTLYFMTDSNGAALKAGSVREFPVKEFKAEEKVFIIADEKDLRDFAACAASCNKAILCSDINVTGEWTPITKFTGEFDGSMHTISGLDDVLFGEVCDGTIRDLILSSDITECSTGYFASLVTQLTGKGRIMNCHYSGNMTAIFPDDVSRIGGLVGKMDGIQAEISNCSCSGSINATYITTGSVYAGSIIAYANAGVVRDCLFNGTVSLNGNSKNAFAGGIAGRCQEEVVFNNCENKGTVTSGQDFKTTSLCFFGGTVGYCTCSICGCVNSGLVECNGSSVAGLCMGGVTGTSCSTIEECINNGKVILSAPVVTSTAYVGGVAGNLDKAAALNLSGLKSTTTASVTVNSPKSAVCICEGGILGTSNLDRLELDGCVNEADVEVNGSCPTYSPGLLMGGIMGGSVRTSATALTFKSCRNKGLIHIEEQTNSSNVVYAGGIIGLAGSGAKGKALDMSMSDCHNEGDITRMVNDMVFKSNDRTFCGGICGAIGGDNRSHGTYDNVNAMVSDCSNSGTIVFNRFSGETSFKETVLNESYTGGIAGVTNCASGYQAVVSNCGNSGNILSTAGYNAGIVAFSNLGTRICGEKTADGVIYTKNSGRIGMFNPDNYGETGGGYMLSGGICACLKESSYSVAIEYCSNEGLVAASTDGKIGAGGIVADLRISDAVQHCRNNAIVRFLPSGRCTVSNAVATGQISGKGTDFKVRDCAVGGRYGRKGTTTAGLDKFGGDERYLFSKFIYALSSDITTQDQLDVFAPGCTWWDGVTPPDWETSSAD